MVTVSVVIPSYNRGYCIRGCLESVLKQTWQDFEIIVVDDASKDDTRQQVALVADPRIKYVAHETNKGGNAARNTGIAASQGEFVAFLDSDDSWTVDKLEKQLSQLRSKGAAYGMSYSWFVFVDDSGQEWRRMTETLDGLACPQLLERNCVGTFSSVLIRRSVLQQVGGLDQDMRSCQDWDLFVRVNKVTSVCCYEECLVIYLDSSNDKFRISTNPQSVILGHRRMLSKIEEQLSQSPALVRAASLRRFTEVFISAGAWRDALKSACGVLKASPSAGSLGWASLIVARGFRRVGRLLYRGPRNSSV